MGDKLQCPRNTSEWGKVLITDLAKRFIKLGEKIDGVKDDINDNTNTKFEQLKSEIDNISTTANDALKLAKENKTELEKLRSEVKEEMDFLKFTCEKLTSENTKLKEDTEKLENYGRRDNIIFTGINEESNETKMEVENKARQFMVDHLKMEKTDVENIHFVRVHRLGAPRKDWKTGKPIQQQKRPIIARFSKFSDKTRVWNARRNITDPKVHINENFSSNTEFNRKKLYAIYRKAKNDAKYKSKVSLIGDALIIDSRRYTVDDLSNLPNDLLPRQFGERSDDNCVCFGGIHSNSSPFSNWYSCKIPYMGYSFNSTEQAYQFAKAIYCDDESAALKIRFTTDPKSAKVLGSQVKGLAETDWERTKSEIMYELIKIKFTEIPELKQEILKTGNKQLAECGTDEYYSIGITINSRDVFDQSKWLGTNTLGKILCKVRDDIRNR